ncbi:hypothetical protein GCM10027085_12650 [Spirosoma aerophilum]
MESSVINVPFLTRAETRAARQMAIAGNRKTTIKPSQTMTWLRVVSRLAYELNVEIFIHTGWLSWCDTAKPNQPSGRNGYVQVY